MRNAITLTLKTFQHIDALILNAAIADMGRIGDPEITTDFWRKEFDINFFSLVYTIQAALPALRKSELGARVVFVSSGAATGGTAGMGAYSATKAAMNSLSRSVRYPCYTGVKLNIMHQNARE